MIGVVATIKVKPGMGKDFEATANRLVEAVNANEEGCLFYRLFRTEDENTYRFLEAYKDMDAVGAHRAADHFRTIGKEMGAFMDGPPDVVRMEGAS
ncbi:MAG: putative quinol monooxygenase [Minwuia sp.]|uniref:putative quinol monooxygenase n=1 Tax=Minwuia sp. TaxID=2493630 RepID=UPI003A880670